MLTFAYQSMQLTCVTESNGRKNFQCKKKKMEKGVTHRPSKEINMSVYLSQQFEVFTYIFLWLSLGQHRIQFKIWDLGIVLCSPCLLAYQELLALSNKLEIQKISNISLCILMENNFVLPL